MTITPEEKEVINSMLTSMETELSNIINARDDVYALLRINIDVNNDTIENNVLSGAKTKAKTAAQEIITLLS